jgi:hypothetical protein
MREYRTRLFRTALVFWFAAVVFVPGWTRRLYADQDADPSVLLDRVAERAQNRPEIKNWRAKVVSVAIEMDNNWKPKKTTRITKTVEVSESGRREHVSEAIRTEKGVAKDITDEVIREQQESGANAKPEENESEGGGEKRGMSRSLSLEELLPFGEKARQNFTFSRLPDEIIDGRTVYVLESRARTKDEKLWEGLYFIIPESYDVAGVRLTISKNPKFVKELSSKIDFQILPDGRLFIKKTWMKVDAGMILKHIRMVVEEEYSDVEIL